MKFSELVKSIESDFLKKDLPILKVGDFVNVNVLIQEATKKRLQAYQGTIISQHRAHLNSTITVARVSKGIKITRIFPIHSRDIESITHETPSVGQGKKGKKGKSNGTMGFTSKKGSRKGGTSPRPSN